MNIDLTEFRDEAVVSISIKGELADKALNYNGRDLIFIKPIQYKGQAYKLGKEIFLNLDICFSYQEACGRCLEAFIKEEKTVLSGKLQKLNHEGEEEEEEEIIFYNEEELDLRDSILNTIVLSLPMKPLCNEGCKGLCPHCGINLNKNTCDCLVEDIDPRFAALKNFFPNK